MEKIILIKYGELTTKKGNRKLFISALYNNVSNKLKDYDIKITKTRDRMYIHNCGDNFEAITKIVGNIFGIHGFVIAYKIKPDYDLLLETANVIVSKLDVKTFKVDSKRSDKNFPMKSPELSSKVGGFLLKNNQHLSVDIHDPELKLRLEIREDAYYIYADEYVGLGGYPVGVAGKGLLMLSGGIDSPVAGYLAMKRGIRIDAIYFDSPPHTSQEALNKVAKLSEIISIYGNKVKLNVVPFTEIQEAIYKNVPHSYMITIMRRMMYRISERYATMIGAKIIVNGESIGQVASQTLTSLSVINEVTSMPVIRPVACFDKLEIIDVSRKMNAYETSILPFEDCCTIFLPKNPVINPVLSNCLAYEKNFDFEPLIEKAISNIKIYTKEDDKAKSSLL